MDKMIEELARLFPTHDEIVAMEARLKEDLED